LDFHWIRRLQSLSFPAKKVQKGEKLRKKAIRKREANLEKYKRPKGERRRKKEPKEKRKERKNWKESADPKVKS
jgi:hypothetical protein